MKKRLSPYSLYFYLLFVFTTFSPAKVAGSSLCAIFKTICLGYFMMAPMKNTHVQGIESTIKSFDGPPYHYYEGITKTPEGYFASGTSRASGQQNKLVAVDYDEKLNIKWISYFGDNGINQGQSAVIAIDGDRLSSGYTYEYGGGNSDCLILRYNKTGELKWAKTMGTNRREMCYDITPTSDNGCAIVGYASDRTYSSSSSDILIGKLDEQGNSNWTAILATSRSFYGRAVTESKDEHILVAGYGYYSSKYHIIIAKFDSTNGTVLWKHNIPWTSGQYPRGIIPTEDGGVVVAGYGYRYDPDFSFSLSAAYLKINSTGGLQYMYALSDTVNSYYYGFGIAPGLNNTFAITGYSYKSGHYHPFLALFDAHNGNLTLAKHVINSQVEFLNAVTMDEGGDFVGIGYTKRGSSSYYYNGFLVKWQSDNVSSDCSEAFELKKIDLSSIEYGDASFLTAVIIPYEATTIPLPDYMMGIYTNQTTHCMITLSPTVSPTYSPTLLPTTSPTKDPTLLPTNLPTVSPSLSPSKSPSISPTHSPTVEPTHGPTMLPTRIPSKSPTTRPTSNPTKITQGPTQSPAAGLGVDTNDCILGTDPEKCISSKGVVAIIFVVPLILIGGPFVGWAIFRKLKP